jgi:hypothetical protein
MVAEDDQRIISLRLRLQVFDFFLFPLHFDGALSRVALPFKPCLRQDHEFTASFLIEARSHFPMILGPR